LPLGCGTSKGASPDAAATNGDAAACKGPRLTCVRGGPSGTGVACQGFGMDATCVGGQWACPKGMVDPRGCTCGEPGIGRPNQQTCTPTGPVCLDAGTNGDAATDADAGRDMTEVGDAGDASRDQSGGDASCDVGCKPSPSGSSFCEASEVQWICQGPWN